MFFPTPLTPDEEMQSCNPTLFAVVSVNLRPIALKFPVETAADSFTPLAL